ncbi:hypothetical protein ACFZCT_04185 [Streptomyces qaidamensis]|uniref:hypothetical protein n=1 Tax=Streptomyces qaidamensis TaxID=1783515 RepID=UPI0036EFEECC
MTPHDPDLTLPKPGHRPLLDRALTPDRRPSEAVAGRGRAPFCPGRAAAHRPTCGY